MLLLFGALEIAFTGEPQLCMVHPPFSCQPLLFILDTALPLYVGLGSSRLEACIKNVYANQSGASKLKEAQSQLK